MLPSGERNIHVRATHLHAFNMESIEKSPLLSSQDLDVPINEDLSKDKNLSTDNWQRFVPVLGLLAALAWVCFQSLSAIFVQVCL